MKKTLSLLLSIALVISMFTSMASANEATLSTQDKYEAMLEAGIFRGYPDGSAALDKKMTRAQFATVLQRVFNFENALADYTDVAPSHWAAGAIGSATVAGLLKGKGQGKFDPEAGVKIQEIAKIVVLALGYDEVEDGTVEGNVSNWAVGYVAAALELGLIDPQSDYNVPANRGQLVDVTFKVIAAHIDSQITVKSAVVIDNKTVKVTLSNEDVVTVNLDIALEVGVATPINFQYKGSTYETIVTLTALAVAQPNNNNNGNGNGNGNGNEQQSTKIVENGTARAVVIVDPNASEQVQDAANELVEYVNKSTGVQLAIHNSGEGGIPNNLVKIFIGISDPAYLQQITGLLDGLTGDGFVIFPKQTSISIMGRTYWGTRFGVYEFLERYVGVRWLMPGPNGEDVPQSSNLIVPLEHVRQEPVFISRLLSPINNSSFYPLQAEWAEHNRIHGTINFHHNFLNLFPPSIYGVTNPEFYPSVNGQPQIPSNDTDENWQPCFTAPGIVDAAVSRIIQYFDENPSETSYSLGMNDSVNFCEAKPGHPDHPNKINSLGFVDMSDIYYNWVNQVAEGVQEVYPDKWFGVLAYLNVLNPPSFPLNPKVIPYITKDRMVWINEDVQAEDKALMAQWKLVAQNSAWYDYLWGAPYMLPRVYPHIMAENYRYAEEQGVIGHYAELYPNWGEGPKPWLSAKLQWNPNQDVDALLEEWYIRAVGAEAAPDLKAYYDHWENFFTVRIKESNWFAGWVKKTYSSFNEAGYLSLVSEEEIAYSRELLESVVTKADTSQQVARAELLLRAFEYYEASALSYPKKIPVPTTEEEALNLLPQLVGAPYYYNKRMDLVEQFRDDPVLVHPAEPTTYGLTWSIFNSSAFWGVLTYLKENESEGGAVQNEISRLIIAENTPQLLIDALQFLLDLITDNTSISANSSFEIGGNEAVSWDPWVQSQGNITRVTSISKTGNASLKISGLDRGGPHQVIPVQEGLFAASVNYYTPLGTDPDGTIQLALNFWDASGNQLNTWKGDSIKLSTTAGQWASISMLEEIPKTINDIEVKSVQFIIVVDDFIQRDELYLDDAVVFQPLSSRSLASTFWTYYENITQSKPGSQILQQNLEVLAQNPSPSEESHLAQLLLDILSGVLPNSINSSFDTGAGEAPPWVYWVNSVGNMQRVTDKAHTGNASLLIDDLDRGGPLQMFDIKPGPFAARTSFYAPIGNSSEGHVFISMNLYDENEQFITNIASSAQSISNNPGSWSSVDWVYTIPEEINNQVVKSAMFTILINGLGEGNSLYLDDAIVYQIEPN